MTENERDPEVMVRVTLDAALRDWVMERMTEQDRKNDRHAERLADMIEELRKECRQFVVLQCEKQAGLITAVTGCETRVDILET